MSSSTTSNGHTIPLADNKNVMVLNTQSSIKLTGSNFPAWKVQINALLVGYDLVGFVDGTKMCPAAAHSDYNYWTRQDQLILHAIISSVDQSVITMLGNVKTSKQTWDILNKMYASKTRSRIMHLKERLTRFKKGSLSIAEYLNGIKSVSDELAVINSTVDDVDLVIHTLNGLGSEYKEVSAALRTRENPITFEELHDLLTDYESYLHRDEETPTPVPTALSAQKGRQHYHKRGYNPAQQGSSTNNRSTSPGSNKRVICQYCEKSGHTAKICYKLHGYPNQKRNTGPSAHHVRHAPYGSGSDWIIDSGATHHITNDLDGLHLTNPYHGADHLIVGNGSGAPITHTGNTVLHTNSHTLHLSEVLHVPTITKKLLSVSSLCQTNPVSVEFFSNHFLVKDLKTQVPLLKGLHRNGLYHMPHPSSTPTALITTSTSTQPWHHILDHPSKRIMRHLSVHNKLQEPQDQFCVSCSSVKSHKLPFSSSSLISKQPLEIVYTDVWGPTPTRSLDGFLYYLVFVDHFSKYTWLFPLKNKSDVSFVFSQFKNVVEKFFKFPIVSLYSDNGGEFIKLKSFLSAHGISHFTTPPHTPELNATAERRHRHIVETGKALLYHAKLPPIFWSFAFKTATYLINRLPTPNLKMKSPYQILHHTKPNPLHLHSFGCLCFPWLKPYTSNKLQPRSTPCIFIGYSTSQYAYQCFDPITHKIYTSRHVSFYDNKFPYTSLTSPKPPPPELPINLYQAPHTILPLPQHINSSPTLQTPNSQQSASPLCSEAPMCSENLPGNASPCSSSPHVTSHENNHATDSNHDYHVVTRSKNNIFKPKKLYHVSNHPLLENLEPSNIRQAMQYAHWRQAISEEFDALIKNGTWSLVPAPPNQNIVECKWLFRIKRNSDGSIARYKARLVAKGFTQCPGVDFHETFALVVRPQTIKLILTIALANKWPMHQLDVNNAFLQGTLQEEVYMEQPPGLKDAQHPKHVCKLHKAIYGLRQAPRAWHEALKEFITSYGFIMSISDPSLFIYATGGTLAYFLVYVDDLLLTGNDSKFLQTFIGSLSNRFSLKNMGSPHYFLGVEIIPLQSGLLLSQHKFIRDILEKFDMADAKPSPTPLSSTATLSLNDGSANVDATHYRKIIGALQYLNLARPDLSFAINKLSQFMHKPTTTHLQHVKRLMRYLKSTINFGLMLKKPSSFQLLAYTDADWGGNQDDRTSTSAYLIFFGGNPISWFSKKQRTVARSSTEAEYRAVATATAELMWLTNLIFELKIPIQHKPKLLCDNVGATYLCSNPVFHSRMKHISMDYHFVREQVQAGKLQVSYVSTKDQLADILTKPLPTSRFHDLTSKMKVTDGNFILRGRIRDTQVNTQQS